jgi:hypothetical protein
MTTKIKTTLLTAFFFLGLLTGLQAQDKYDFTMVYLDYSKFTVVIHVIENDVQEKIIETGKKSTDISGNNKKLLSVLSQLTTEGWEIFNASASSNTTSTFYLKRKKKS